MKKRLYRSSRDRMIAGVAGGLAEYFDVDPVIIRAAFVILMLTGGFGFLGYIILWIIVPYDYTLNQNTTYESTPSNSFVENSIVEKKESNKTGSYVIAGIFIVLGALLLLHNILDNFSFKISFPIVIILIGILILFLGTKSKGNK